MSRGGRRTTLREVQNEDLGAVFLRAVTPGAAFEVPASLEGDLRERLDGGRAAWPQLALEDAVFVRHLAFPGDTSLPPLKHAPDLWLACACANGVKGAAAAFERQHRRTIERAVAQVNRAAVEEVTQAVMVSLLVAAEGARPRIAEYRGHAALRTWLATVAANTTLNQVKLRANQPYDSLGGVGAAVAGIEPELAMAKARYAGDLDVALREALAALDERRRVLLRLHHVKGWTVDRLATMYRVSRSGAGRLLVDAREALLEDTKRRLIARLKLTPSELGSMVVALRSNLQVSIVRMLDENG